MIFNFLFLLAPLSAATAAVVSNDVLVMRGNVSLAEMNSRSDRNVMYIAVNKKDDACSQLIPNHNPVCVFCLNNMCDGIERGQMLAFVYRNDPYSCQLKYRIVSSPRSDLTCKPFLNTIIVDERQSTLTRNLNK